MDIYVCIYELDVNVHGLVSNVQEETADAWKQFI